MDILLKKMLNERVHLAKEGKIKNQKDPEKYREDERPFDIPSGWEWARFPVVCSYKPGKTPSTKNPVYWSQSESDVPWVSISDMEHFERVNKTQKTVTQEAIDQVFKCPPVSAGTILMSFKLTVGKISILDFDAYHNEAIISIEPFTGMDRDYLFKILPARALAGNTKRAIMGKTLTTNPHQLCSRKLRLKKEAY